jgi:hypothetical protein
LVDSGLFSNTEKSHRIIYSKKISSRFCVRSVLQAESDGIITWPENKQMRYLAFKEAYKIVMK